LENQRGGLLHALEVFDAIKQSTQQTKEKFNIVDDFEVKNIKISEPVKMERLNTYNNVKRDKPSTDSKERLNTEINYKNDKTLASEISYKQERLNTEGNIKREKSVTKEEQKITFDRLTKLSPSPDSRNIIPSKNITISSSNGDRKKGINVIPIKPLNANKDNYVSNFNPIDKIRIDRFSPKPKDIKISGTNVSPRQKLSPVSQLPQRSEKITFDSKYSNKLYKELASNLMNKSPSPKQSDIKKK
jgi:hypothetical protein